MESTRRQRLSEFVDWTSQRIRGDEYDCLGGLFVETNTPGKTPGGRYKGVEYFNGGLFAEPARIELASDELNQLQQAAREDWSQVRPDMLFEHSPDHVCDARH